MKTFSLKQHVVEATHKKGHVLDLVMTREEELEVWSMQNHGPILCGHLPIPFRIPCKLPSLTQRTFTYDKLKDIDPEQFSSDIDSSDLSINPAETFDELVSQYNNILSGLLDKHAPTAVKHLCTHVSSPWFAAEIKAQKILYCQAERKWPKHTQTVNFPLYHAAYLQHRPLCCKAKKFFEAKSPGVHKSQVPLCSGRQAHV